MLLLHWTVTQEQLESSKAADGVFCVCPRRWVVDKTGVEYQYESALQGVRRTNGVCWRCWYVLSHSTSIALRAAQMLVPWPLMQTSKSSRSIPVSVINTARSQDSKVAVQVWYTLIAQRWSYCCASYPTYSLNVCWRYFQFWLTRFLSEEGKRSADNQLLDSTHLDLPSKHLLLCWLQIRHLWRKFKLVLHGFLDWFLASSTACNCWLLSGHGTVNLITGTTNLRHCFYEIAAGFFYNNDQSRGHARDISCLWTWVRFLVLTFQKRHLVMFLMQSGSGITLPVASRCS